MKLLKQDFLERPDAAKLVRATPAQPLFLHIKALGLPDALEILKLCSTEQVQAFLDMDGWDRDRLSIDRLAPWIAALTELGPQKLAAHVNRLDREVLTNFLCPQMRVYELTDEEPPDEPEGMFWATPDRFYMIDLLPNAEGDSDRPALLQRFLDMLYRGDLDLARSIIQSARWDGGAETEETSYRFRSGRMADLGYVEYHQALEVYILLDPLAPPPPEPKQPHQQHLAAVGEPELAISSLAGFDDLESTFVRAAAHLAPPEQELVYQHLLVLANRVMSADRVELGDADAAIAVLRRTVGYLSMGLEFRLLPPDARKNASAPQVRVNLADAAELLQKTSLIYLFRLGYSLTVQLRKLAGLLTLGQEDGLTTLIAKDAPTSLLPPRLAEPLHALLLVRPLYSGYLDAEPRRDERTPPQRPFLSLADLGRAATFLSELSTLGKFLTTGLGLRRENLAEVLSKTMPNLHEAKLGDLLGTMLANLILQRPPVCVPIPRRDLPALREAALGGGDTGRLRPAVELKLREAVQTRLSERAFGQGELAQLWTPTSQRFLDETLAELGQSLANLPESLSGELADAVGRLDGLILA